PRRRPPDRTVRGGPLPAAGPGTEPAGTPVLAGGGLRRRHRGPRPRVGAGGSGSARCADPPAAVAGVLGGPAGDPRMAGLHRGAGGRAHRGGSGPRHGSGPARLSGSAWVKRCGRYSPAQTPAPHKELRMIRTLPLLALALCLGLAATAPAQGQHRPGEDLRPLPAARQVELIEREYAAQSRGRAIPDDQLAYYLDQIQGGWGLGQVRQDIGHSLQGRGGRQWNGSSWSGQTLVCSSDERRRRQCRTPFNGRPVLVENISSTRCVEGRNFGGGGGTMWVDGGCRGRFSEGRGHVNPGHPGGAVVRCESRDNRQQACAFGGGRAVLVRQLSKAACVE